MHVHVQMLALDYLWSISTENCLITLLTALLKLQATTTCLPTWSTGWHHSASPIMSWWKVSKRGWAHRQRTSLTQAWKNLYPDDKCSFLAMTILRSSLHTYVYFVYNIFFLNACFINSSVEVTFQIALVYYVSRWTHYKPKLCTGNVKYRIFLLNFI
jgi:hypothetical protein